ncbi:MAG: XRE family transcriptional regulator [Clostridiales bacterium 42_27]|nr:MAG: XRE family transcriptional regulator [Clostridiales bacterium 42_27]
MNIKLTLGERLKDLRVERNLKLEMLAEQTSLSKSALSKYESDDATDLSIYAVTTLAEFYGVTTDYLLGVTENKKRKRPDAVLSDLHLSDGAVDVLRNGKFNHRLLCELLEHPDFARWMTDLEICVDGLVSDRIRDMNAMVEATRQELEKRYHADTEGLTMRTLKAAQINEDEYFGRILYDELAAILKQIKAAHVTDKTTSDGAAIEQARKQLEDAQKFEGSPLEKKMNVLMGQIGIDYSKLTKEEQMTLLRVFNKSSMLKHRAKAGMRGKHRR